jgi:DNA polymerase
VTELKMITVPTEETLRRFPGLVALQVVYENHAHGCTKCDLHKERTKIVFGHGASEEPPIAFVGEAPGKDEDEQGYPFVGKAGQLLTLMIEAMKLSREEVYILNSVCCRPPGNRNPAKEEQAACWPLMAAQLKAVRPQTIVVLGSQAARALLRTDRGVGDLRNKWHAWDGIPVRVTYHPAYLLRKQEMKTRAWTDLRAVLGKLGREVPE